MPNIDERVVQMTFDNKQFEAGVSESLKTLDDLKKALNFDEVEGSLKNIENAFNNLDLSGLANSVDFIASRFEPLGKIADAALGRIADKALDAGKKITDAFFGFSDFSAGQGKYETQTKAVQTITNATGKSVDEVEKVLARLQNYTDETSYDFAEMVSSIGKFTSVGIELERAEAAMEGIASEAAKSGAGKAEANRAMYNFAQALSTGYVKLIDWKSIENANMATKEFKETLIETAIEEGVLERKGNGVGEMLKKTSSGTKKVNVDFKSFNQTLSEEWLTSDVLIKTLEKYADTTTDFGLAAYHAAQEALTWSDALGAVKDAVSSGWMDSFKYMFGNLDEARVLWTDVANALVEYVDIFASWRNEILKSWHELGGYNDMIEAASNLWQTFMNIVRGVGEALTNVFPILKPENMTQVLTEATKKLKDWSAGLLDMFGLYQEVQEEEEETANQAEQIADTVDGITESTKEASNAMSELGDSTKDAVDSLGSIQTGLKRGMRGEEVKELQKQLMKFGFRLDKFGADGIFGPETQAAVKAFQREIGVAETGIMDEATKAALKADATLQKLQERAEKGLSIGSRGEDIKQIQKDLNKHLGDADQLIVDGIYGPKTEAAIKKLQKELGVAQNGVWDQATENALKTKKILLMSVKTISKGLKESMRGADVKSLQQELIKGGYLDADMADGIYGPKTKEAVKKLQHALGITETGEWDTQTLKALRNAQTIARYSSIVSDSTQKAAEDNQEASEKADEATEHTSIAMMRLQNIVRGWGSALKIAKNFAGAVVEIAGNILGMFSPLVDVATRFGSVFGGMFENLARDLDENNVYGTFVENVTNAFGPLGGFIQNVADSLNRFLDSYDEFLETTGKRNTFGNFFSFLGNYLKKVPAIAFIIDIFEAVKDVVGPIISFLIDELKKLIGWFGSDGFKQAKDSVFVWISDKLTTLREAIEKFKEDHPELTIENFITKIKEIGGWLGGKIGVGFDVIKEKFTEFRETINKFKEGHPEFSITNIFEKIKGAFNSIGDMFSSFFARGQQSESGTFFDELKERFKAFEPVLNWLEGIKDRIIKLWQSIFGGGKDSIVSTTTTTKTTNPSDSPVVKTIEVVEEKVSLFDRVVNWFVEIKDKLVAAWNGLLGINKGEGLEVPKADGFVSVADKLKDFGKWILDNWPAISLAVIGIGASYALVSAIQIAKNLGKGFKDLGGTLKSLFGKEEEKDTIGNTALKIAGAIMIVAAAVGLLSFIDADKAWDGIVPFLAVLGAMATAIILINKLGGDNGDGAKQALMIAGSIGIIAFAIWLMCATIKKYAEGNIIVSSMVIIGLMIGALAAIAIYLTKQPGSGVELKGFLAMCAGVLVLTVAFGKMTKILTKNIDRPGTIAAAFGIIEAMIWSLGGIAILVAKYSSGGNAGATFKGFASMCAGVMILAYTFDKLMRILVGNIDKPGTILAAFGIIEAMVWSLGGIAILTAKESRGGEAGMRGFLGMCGGVLVLALAFEKVLDVITNDNYSNGQIWGAFGIIEGMVLTLGIVSLMLSRSSNRGKVKIVGMLALVGALWVLVEAFKRIADTISKNNKLVNAAAFVAITGMLGMLAYIAASMGKTSGSFIGAIGNAVTFVTLAYAMEKIVNAIGDVLLKIKEVDPEILKWFFIGIDAAIAIMAATVAVLGKLFESNPIGLIIGEAGLLALLGVLAAGVYILAAVAESALLHFSNALTYIGWGLKAFYDATSKVNLKRLKKVGEFLKNDLPEMVRDVLGIPTSGLTDKMSAIRDMGTKIHLFGNSLSKVGQAALDGADKAKHLIEKADEIGDTLGEATIPDLGKLGSLYMFGTGLYAYGYTLSQLKSGDDSVVSNVVTQTNSLLGIVTDTEKLKKATESIQALGGALEVYFQALETREIDENGQAVENTPIDVQKMADKMKELVGAFNEEEITELTSYGEGKQHDMTAVANGIAQLSLAFKSYGENIGALKQEDINRANGVIDKVQGMTYNQESIDGFYTNFSGISVPGAFIVALEIYGLGLALSAYAENIGKLKAKKVEAANKVLSKIIEIYELKSKLDKPADVLDLLWKAFHSDSNEFNITQFSSDIGGIAEALEVYAGATENLTDTKVENSNNVLSKMLEISTTLEGQNWWTRLLFGDASSLVNFAANAQKLGEGLASFGNAISNASFDEQKIDYLMKEEGPVDRLLSFMSDVNTLTDLAKLMGGNRDWSTFSSGFSNLATELIGFQNNLTDSFDVGKIEGGLSALERLAGILKGFNIDDLFTTDFVTGTMVSKGPVIAKLMTTFMTDIANAFSDEESQGGLVSGMAVAGQKIVDALSSGIANANTKSLESSLFGSIDVAVFHLSISSDMASIMNGLGTDLLSWIRDGMTDSNEITKVESSVEVIIGRLKTAFTNRWDDFKGIGQFVDMGIALGIQSNQSIVTDAAEDVALEAYLAACKVLGVQSPSREFMWIGEMLDAGLVEGLMTYGQNVSNAAGNVASDAVSTAEKGVLALNDVLGFDGNYQPVIRPVVDLSDFQNGMKTVDGLLDSRMLAATSSFTIASTVASARAASESRQEQYEDHSYEIVAGIQEMGDRITNLATQMAEQMSNLKIVMDSGALVGQIDTKIDQRLGQMTKYNGRRM